MPKRESMMLAHVFKPDKHPVAGRWMSEKLDGQRAFWDGGISRGLLASEVPYANTTKDHRLVTPPVATGLWSRYWKVIHAPARWLDHLPKGKPLDGELYAGRGKFQTLSSIAKKHLAKSDPEAWMEQIRYKVFDSPNLDTMFADGEIKTTNLTITLKGVCEFLKYHGYKGRQFSLKGFIHHFKPTLKDNYIVHLHDQFELPFSTDLALKMIYNDLEKICDMGGEGLIIRDPNMIWAPHRTHSMLKVKPYLDDEAVVIGYTTGQKTNLGSKLLGMMGALILDYRGKVFELSGFTNEERLLWTTKECSIEDRKSDALYWARAHPKTEAPDWIEARKFPRGAVVTFRYRELSDDGVPKEARYHRLR